MLTSISGRSVIVTGASKGIGKGIARVFANQGAKVLVVSRTLADAEACANEIGNGASAFSADVGDWDQCQAMAAAVAAGPPWCAPPSKLPPRAPYLNLVGRF